MSPWKPISEYPIEPGPEVATGPLVLARNEEKRPMCVIMARGKFYLCPGAAVYYGDNQVGFLTCSDLVEFMDIPA